MAKPVPREVGVQVPRGNCTEVPEEVVVREAEELGRPDPEGFVPTEGRRGDREQPGRRHFGEFAGRGALRIRIHR